jgi:hypothetical protein
MLFIEGFKVIILWSNMEKNMKLLRKIGCISKKLREKTKTLILCEKDFLEWEYTHDKLSAWLTKLLENQYINVVEKNWEVKYLHNGKKLKWVFNSGKSKEEFLNYIIERYEIFSENQPNEKCPIPNESLSFFCSFGYGFTYYNPIDKNIHHVK